MALSERVIKYFRDPLHIGHLEETDDVGTGTIGIRACGGVWTKMQLRIVDGVIIESKFKTFGCATAIACSAYVTESVVGKGLDEVECIDAKHIGGFLTIMKHKKHCAEVAEKALKSAIANYRSKNDNAN